MIAINRAPRRSLYARVMKTQDSFCTETVYGAISRGIRLARARHIGDDLIERGSLARGMQFIGRGVDDTLAARLNSLHATFVLTPCPHLPPVSLQLVRFFF